MANKLQVRICGQEYTLVSDNSREYMLETADYIDRKMVQIKNQNNRLSTSMAAVLVALNVAEDLRTQHARDEETIESLKAELALLKKKLEESKRPVQKAQEVRTAAPQRSQQGSVPHGASNGMPGGMPNGTRK